MQARSTVKGILLDSSGQPVSNAIVMIAEGDSDFNDIASVSNDKGEFYISNVTIPGEYVLQIKGTNRQIRKQVNLLSKDTVVKITF